VLLAVLISGRDHTRCGEGLSLWIKSDQACKPGLTLVSGREVPLGT
jgi:hypothetical protein